MNYNELINLIVESFQTGVPKNITADKLREALVNILQFSNISKGDFRGLVGTSDNPGSVSEPVFFIAREPGFYHNFGNVETGNGFYIISWDGNNWSSTGLPFNLSGFIGLSDVVDNLETPNPEKPLSARQGNLIRSRILPEGGEFENFDRPDLASAEINGNGEIISLKYTGIVGDDLNKLIVDATYDRPDLGLTVIDKDGFLLFNEGEGPRPGPGPSPDDSLAYVKKFWEPPLQEAFRADDEIVTNYSALIAAWDQILSDYPTNPELEAYIKKTNMGVSSSGSINVFRYDFKPPNPKFKILLFAGIHASEKMYIKQLYEFFKELTAFWYRDSSLQWLRWNVHFVAVPCLCPSAIVGLGGTGRGGRRVWETDPIPVSWTKSGTTVTVTFNTNDFPDTNGRLSAWEYFSHPGIAGKTWVTIYDSSSQTGLPDQGYIIGTVINGTTITVQAPSGGSTSGTAKLYVQTSKACNR